MGSPPRATFQSGERAAWRAYVRNARGKCWRLTRRRFAQLIQMNCCYCGAPPRNYIRFLLFTFLYQGIDRMNNAEGYTKGNTVPCCHRCNAIKGNKLSHEEMIFVAQTLSRLTRAVARLRSVQELEARAGSTDCTRRELRVKSSSRQSRVRGPRKNRKQP